MARIKSWGIALGRPLVFDCFDNSGNLLLRRGQVITSQNQLDVLIERGLFGDAMPAGESRDDPDREVKQTPFSVMEKCKDRVRGLFNNIKAHCGVAMPERVDFVELTQIYREAIRNLNLGRSSHFSEQIVNVCKGIQVMCRIDEDAAIGSVHLDPICRYTTIHPIHKAVLSELVAIRMEIPPQERLSILAAALTANISILNLQDALHAQNRPLNETEAELIRLHPQLSAEMLAELGVTDLAWIQTVLQHHERQDGSGYPRGLNGVDIGRGAKILAMADTYGTLVKPCAKHAALPGKEIMRRMFVERGEMVESELIQIFIKTLGIYPPGSFVKLRSGETAVVTRRGKNPATPLVKCVRDALGMPLAYFSRRDTALPSYAIGEVLPRDPLMALNAHALWDYKC